MSKIVKKGDVFRVTYPFVRVKISLYDEDGLNEFDSWRPGTDSRMIPPDDCEAYAHGEGHMRLTVVSTHKPGKYRERVFYTRKFIDPEGKEFGKGNLHVCSIQKFRRIASAFYYDYVVDPDEKP